MYGPSFGPELARPWLAGLDPRVKIAWVAAISIVAVSVDGASSLGALVAVAALGATGLRLRSRGWATIVGLLALTTWSAMLTQGFFYVDESRTPLVVLVAPRADDPLGSGLVLSREGLLYGAVQSLRLVATSLAGFTTCLSTGPERLLAALAWLRLPPALGFMTTAALRFLPLLIEEIGVVRQARRLRGGGPFDRRRGARLFEMPGLLFPVLAAVVRRSETLAESITARGFDARAPRTFYPPLRMRPWEGAIVSTLAVIVAAIVTMRSLRAW